VNLDIVRVATREVLEAYMLAIRNRDYWAADFWRPYVVERLELLNAHRADIDATCGTDSDEP